jgi:hypothetical protein
MTKKTSLIETLTGTIARVAKLDKCYPNFDNGMIAIPFCNYGDYDSSCGVERSNYIEARKMFRNVKGIKTWYGYYGQALVVELERLSTASLEKLLELVESLEKYPCIDDNALCEYEYKAIMRAWKGWFKQDVKRGLRGKAESVLRSDWQSYACIEMGGDAYIDTELLVKYL